MGLVGTGGGRGPITGRGDAGMGVCGCHTPSALTFPLAKCARSRKSPLMTTETIEPALIAAAKTAGAEHFIVEHDMPPEPFWPSVEASLAYLRGLA